MFFFFSMALSNQFLLNLFKAAQKYFSILWHCFCLFWKEIGVFSHLLSPRVCRRLFVLLVHFPFVWLAVCSFDCRVARSFMRYLVCSFIHCFRSFVSWPFIRSHGLCIHPLPLALSFPSCHYLLVNSWMINPIIKSEIY